MVLQPLLEILSCNPLNIWTGAHIILHNPLQAIDRHQSKDTRKSKRTAMCMIALVEFWLPISPLDSTLTAIRRRRFLFLVSNFWCRAYLHSTTMPFLGSNRQHSNPLWYTDRLAIYLLCDWLCTSLHCMEEQLPSMIKMMITQCPRKWQFFSSQVVVVAIEGKSCTNQQYENRAHFCTYFVL